MRNHPPRLVFVVAAAAALALVCLPGPARALLPDGAGQGTAASLPGAAADAAVAIPKVSTTSASVYPNLQAPVSGSGFRAGQVVISMDGTVLKRVKVPASGRSPPP